MAATRRSVARTTQGRKHSIRCRRPAGLALLGALVLAVVAGMASMLAGGLPAARAAAQPSAHTTYYGIPDGVMPRAPEGGSPTPTDTATPTATATATAAPTPTATPTPKPTVPGNPYDLDISAAVKESGWPQQNSNWCGIATIAAIADFLNPGAHASQSAIVSELNTTSSESEWGYPQPDASDWGPYLAADIARDFGTDPRSLAEGLTLATGQQYHVIVDLNGAYDATIHLVDDLLNSRQPISVIVDHGEHSVLVSGVDATANPLNDPGSIKDIHVWDPGGGVPYVGIQPSEEETVSMSDWLSGIISWSGSDYFAYPYAANVYQGRALDPDPGVGPYQYIPSKYDHLWIGHYVYLSPVASGPAASLNADWELDQNDVLIAGIASSQYAGVPPGYAGPTVPMPNNAPPPPPPVQPVVVAPPPAPLPPPTPTPRPTPTRTPVRKPVSSMPTSVSSDPTAVTQPHQATCTGMRCLLAGLGAGWSAVLGALLLMAALAVVMVLRARWRVGSPAEPPPPAAAPPSPAGEATETAEPVTAPGLATADMPELVTTAVPVAGSAEIPAPPAADEARGLGDGRQAPGGG